MTTKTIKAAAIVAKILEVAGFAAFIAYIVLLILFIAKPDLTAPLVETITSSNNSKKIQSEWFAKSVFSLY